ncbi:MAG: ATP-binding cassette domain-containing protein [Bacteroidaceae bacterium]|nr:ATP-binding cassette domain-containing protein [Bacteroidaceae bacterium]
MIEVRNISKVFESGQGIRDISATFLPGRINMVIGKSGSGKTVLLKCISGLTETDSGSVLYENNNTVSRGEVGMLFQNSALFDYMNVLQNVMFPLDMFSRDSYAQRKERAMYCLEKVGLADAADKMIGELSGGMQKRTAIARAISLNPKYLLCDEPNSGLDPITSRIIDDLLKNITTEFNTTTIINTHDIGSVNHIADHILFMNQGSAVWQGDKSQFNTADNRLLREFLSAY